MSAAMDLAKEQILERIAQSDENEAGGTHYQSESYLGRIDFHDFMDTTLFIISLQPGRKTLTRVDTKEFWEHVHEMMREWYSRFEEAWGDREAYLNSGIWRAWNPGPGPLGGTESPAHTYAYRAGFTGFKQLSSYFDFVNPEPGERSSVGMLTGWSDWSRSFDAYLLPKFKREEHNAKLEIIFDFAEELITWMREN